MRLLAAILRFEGLLQLRSLRFRIGVALYLAASAIPAAVLFYGRDDTWFEYGAASYFRQTLTLQPFLVTLLSMMVAGTAARFDRATRTVLGPSAMSNAGCLMRRWVAVTCLVLPLTLLPLLLTVVLIQVAEAGAIDLAYPLWVWALYLVPLCVSTSAFWLGIVTITKSEIASLVLSVWGGGLLLALVNQGLFFMSLNLAGPGAWTGRDPFFFWFSRFTYAFRRDDYAVSQVATDAPLDVAALVQYLLPLAALGVGCAACALGMAVAFVGRTSRDLPPRRMSRKHPLRTFRRALARIRQRYVPDAALSRWDHLAMVVGTLGLAASLTFLMVRQAHYRDLGEERYGVETQDPIPPLPLTVVPGSWRLEGELSNDGSVALVLEAELENRGDEPQGALAFSLNRETAILELSSPGRSVSVKRAWDRVEIRVEPPLGPGEALGLELHLAGIPAQHHLFLPGYASDSFATRFAGRKGARFPRELSDLSGSETRARISPRGIQLQASDLMPVPRYTPWTLTPPPASINDTGREVPEEGFKPQVDLELRVDVPSSWFVADNCGNTAASGGRLEATCETPLADFELLGGRLERSLGARATAGADPAPLILATYPAHRRHAKRHMEALTRVAELGRKAWPEVEGLAGLVFVEWPPPPRTTVAYQFEPQPIVKRRLVLLPEQLIVHRKPLPAAELAADVLTRELLRRRSVVAEEHLVFDHLYRALSRSRLGSTAKASAIISGQRQDPQLTMPILEAEPSHRTVWRQRLPAVLVEMEDRVGGEILRAGVEAFLSVGPSQAGRVRQLVAAVEAAGGVSLERMYRDYFLGQALPELSLTEVKARRRGSRWLVEGELRNAGTGEVICDVVAKTEIDSTRQEVKVDSQSRTPFLIETFTRPHSVLLDPEEKCVRYVHRTTPKSASQVNFGGE